MTDELLETEAETYEQLRDHVETIDDELASVERLAADCENPSLERNASQLRAVFRTLEMNVPPRPDREDRDGRDDSDDRDADHGT